MMVGEGYTADFLDGSLRRDKATVPAVSSLLVSLLAESSSGFLVAKRTAWDTSMVPASLWLILACLVAASGLERKDTAQREIRGGHVVQGTRREGSSLEQESSWLARARQATVGKERIPKVLGSEQSARAVPLQYKSLEC